MPIYPDACGSSRGHSGPLLHHAAAPHVAWSGQARDTRRRPVRRSRLHLTGVIATLLHLAFR